MDTAQMKNDWWLGSYFTLNTPYEQVIKDFLLYSLKEFPQIRTIIKSVPSQGNWYRNVAEKPNVILRILEELPPEQSLVFTDADARIIKYPELFDTIPEEYDLAVHHLSWNTHYRHVHEPDVLECLSGTLMLRNRQKVRDLCKDWYDLATKSTEWEQRILGNLLKQNRLRIFELPYSYITIPTLPDGRPHPRGTDGAYIVHGQVSRFLKRKLM